MKKYPPTVSIAADSFDLQKLFKKDIEKQFEIINKNEERRGTWNRNFSKYTELKAMQEQCLREAAIRCYTGLSGARNATGCPITFMMDDSERQKEWQKLQNETKDKKIIVDRINWTHPENAGNEQCPSGRADSLIYDTLNMKPSDFKP